MAETVTYAGSASVAGGPTVPFTVTLNVDGYKKFNITVGMGTKQTLNLGTAGATVSLLLIKASTYGSDLTFDAGGGEGALPLDAPLLVGGTGALKLVKAGGVESIEFDNKSTDDVTIDVFVARTPV